ncbi:hypothetical protein MIB92_08035 [Aestuariirhabdus sp. Z084]|uniref:hypothetical protein n=1 Tax=Aestuariirhabdus haliotis TaxID=2918751 RepID=UPI00201B3B8B|nr:hypothetical protein [Aestuariirhabdus haliotis]MCL6415596.1 hypothetical protein [Aestuariirhabdus haliotis]MCL6419591.1 hypothetical protein [Aestuariirhabdus haliotis]
MTNSTRLMDVLGWRARYSKFKWGTVLFLLVSGFFQAIVLACIWFFKKKGSRSGGKDASILYIYPSKKSLKINRQKKMLEFVGETRLAKDVHIKRFRDLLAEQYSPCLDPLSFLFPVQAWRAKHIIKLHSNAKVIAVEKHDGLFNYFLYRYRAGQKIVHVAHSAVTNDSSRFDFAVCDVYIVFGQSSIDTLEKNKVRIGNPRYVVSGPFFFNDVSKWQQQSEFNKLLLVATGPGFDKQEPIRNAYRKIDQWTRTNDIKLFVKPHILGHGYLEWSDNVEVLPAATKLDEIVGQMSAGITVYSNAVIDIAALGFPVCVYGAPDVMDPWLSKSYLCSVWNDGDLVEFFSRVENSADGEIAKSADFVEYHWGNVEEGARTTARILCEMAGEEF